MPQRLQSTQRTAKPKIVIPAQEVRRILTLADIREKFAGRGVVAKPSTPEEFDRFVRAEVEKITKVMKVGGVKIN